MPNISVSPEAASRLPSTARERLVTLLLRLGAVALFLGRGWQHLFWDTPYRSVLWDQSLMEPLIVRLGGDWERYVTSLEVDQLIQSAIYILGFLLLGAGLLLVFAWPRKKWRNLALWTGGIILLVFGIARIKEGYPHWVIALELAIQLSLPFLLWGVTRFGFRRSWRLLCQWAVAFTFIGHGLLAADIYPVPGHFLSMTLSILEVEETGARLFLQVMGILDFVAAALILSGSVLGRYAALYAAAWGFITAVARVWAPFALMPLGNLLHQWLPETIFRLPHGLVPLALAIWLGFSFRRKAHPPAGSRSDPEK